MINDRVRKILAGVRKQREAGGDNRFFYIESGMAIFDRAITEEEQHDFRQAIEDAVRGYKTPETGARVVEYGGVRIQRARR